MVVLTFCLAWAQKAGLENVMGKVRILDNQITASSFLDDAHKPNKARLYGTHSWCAKGANSSLQVDLGSTKELTGIAVQGDKNDKYWVTEFKLEFGYTTHELEQIEVN